VARHTKLKEELLQNCALHLLTREDINVVRRGDQVGKADARLADHVKCLPLTLRPFAGHNLVFASATTRVEFSCDAIIKSLKMRKYLIKIPLNFDPVLLF
jgi:hypothetical protein